MSPIWWYLAGVATPPILFIAWLVIGGLIGVITGRGTFTLTTTVNGQVMHHVGSQRASARRYWRATEADQRGRESWRS